MMNKQQQERLNRLRKKLYPLNIKTGRVQDVRTDDNSTSEIIIAFLAKIFSDKIEDYLRRIFGEKSISEIKDLCNKDLFNKILNHLKNCDLPNQKELKKLIKRLEEGTTTDGKRLWGMLEFDENTTEESGSGGKNPNIGQHPRLKNITPIDDNRHELFIDHRALNGEHRGKYLLKKKYLFHENTKKNKIGEFEMAKNVRLEYEYNLVSYVLKGIDLFLLTDDHY